MATWGAKGFLACRTFSVLAMQCNTSAGKVHSVQLQPLVLVINLGLYLCGQGVTGDAVLLQQSSPELSRHNDGCELPSCLPCSGMLAKDTICAEMAFMLMVSQCLTLQQLHWTSYLLMAGRLIDK